MEQQTFNLNSILSNPTGIFLKILLYIIIVYLFILTVNFFRDKFINKEIRDHNPKFIDFLTVLYKISMFAGFGVLIGTFIEHFFNSINHSYESILSWGNLSVGIILVCIGMGLKNAKKEITSEKQL